MRFSPTLFSIVVAGLVFIGTPYVPTWFLRPVVGTRIGSAIILIAVLAVLQVDRVVALAVALAVAALFLEHRRRVVQSFQYKMAVEINQPLPIKNAPNLVRGELHPPAESPAIDEVGPYPEEENGVSDLEQKAPLDTVDSHNGNTIDILERAGVV